MEAKFWGVDMDKFDVITCSLMFNKLEATDNGNCVMSFSIVKSCNWEIDKTSEIT